MASITFEQVALALDGQVQLSGVDAHIDDGEVVAIIGPSGSGKSTLLRSIAGLVPLAAGRLVIGDRDVSRSQPSERDVAMVFQEPSLLPRRTGRGNVQFPLELRRETLESIRQRVDAEARAMHIEHLLEKWPDTMSRGEAQLVQIARALVRVPSVLLLDEPFAALDEHRRAAMRSELRVLQEGYGVTTVIATNDPADAAALAGRVIALEPGAPEGPGGLAQVGTLDEVRSGPATLEVAAALGELWLIEVEIHHADDGAWLVGRKDPSFRLRHWSPAVAARAGERATIGVRSSAIRLSPTGAHEAVVRRTVPGSNPRLLLTVAGHLVASSQLTDAPAAETIRIDLDHPFVFDATGRRLA